MIRFAWCLTLALVLLLVSSPASIRADEGGRPTALLIEVPSSVPVGESFTVVARLTGPNGELYGAVANEVLQLFIDGLPARRIRTNFAGAAQFVVNQTLAVGPHVVTVVYSGSSTLAPAAASTTVTVAPAVLEIRTVPALPGVLVKAAGNVFSTGPDGIARIPFAEPGSYDIEVSRSVVTPQFHATFARWNDDSFSATRVVVVPRKKVLQVGYDIQATISYRFVDLDGRPVDPTRIEGLVLKSSTGEVRELPAAGRDAVTTVQAGRVIPTHSGLEVSPVQWSVEAVIVHGTNVVNRKQQRFYPIEEQDWTIALLLYSATFTVRDTFLGLPVGRAVRLTYPDGSSQLVPLRDGRATVDSLPRGDYQVEVIGTFGWSPRVPVALSRDQTVDLTVMSGIDLSLIVILVTTSAVALVLAGRPQLGYLRHRLRSAGQPPAAAPEREHRTRRVALLATLVLTLSGTVLLTQGLARSERPRPTPVPTPVASPERTPAPSQLPAARAVPATPPAASTTSTPVVAEIAPQFREFWETNGGLATFGTPLAAAYWTTAEDGATVLAQDFTLARLEYRPGSEGPFAVQLARLGAYEATALGLDSTLPFQPRSSTDPPAADCTYFAQTKHWLCGTFRAFWRRSGIELGDPDISVRESIALLGYPISEAFVDEFGRTVQYFERAKLVAYPEFRGTPNEVIRDPFVRRPA